MKKYLFLALLPLSCTSVLAAKTASTSVNFSGEIYNNTSAVLLPTPIALILAAIPAKLLIK